MNNLQAGIAYDGIAHAGPLRLQPVTWFDGGNDYISTPVTISQNGAITVSWEWWQQRTARERGINENFLPWLLQHSAYATTRYYMPYPGYRYWVVPTPSKTWHHFVISWNGDASTARLYYNGILQTPGNTGAYDLLSYPLILGASQTGALPFEGVIRNCRYYNRQISDVEALAIYQGTPPTPTAYWKGNGNTDDAWRDQVGTAHPTVYGSPERALVREGDEKVILNNIILNP